MKRIADENSRRVVVVPEIAEPVVVRVPPVIVPVEVAHVEFAVLGVAEM